jgi:hypothetical protein
MTLLEKIEKLTWYNLINKLKDILKGLFAKSEEGSYKAYTALLSQDDTNAPTAIIIKNTIGNIVWSRVSEGSYKGTLNGAFPEGKTLAFIGATESGEDNSAEVCFAIRANNNEIIVRSRDTATTAGDNRLRNTSIEIRVYP